MGMVIGIAAERIDEYRRLHAAVWPQILKLIAELQIRNYSIFLREPENLLFSYWEYHGEDFEADMRIMSEDPETRRWWALCSPCQVPLASRAQGEHWAGMEQIFFTDSP